MAGNQIVTVKEADGTTLTDVEVLGMGRQAATSSKSVALSNEDNALVGALTETAPATDTASSGLNGRLQRLAQKLTSMVTLLAGGLPAALGASGGLKVDGSGTALPVNATLNAETTKVLGATRTLGNIGAAIDFTGQNATFPGNSWMVGAQFNTTPTTVVTGNVSPLQMDSAGNLLVNIKAGGGAGGTSLADGGTFTAGTTVGTPAGGFYQTTPTSNPLTTGKFGWAQMTANRANHVNLRDALGNELVSAASAGSPAASVPAIVVTLRDTNANGQQAMAGSSPVVIASNQSTIPIGGVVASGSTASGNPVPGAGLAVTSETVVANGQAAAFITDLARKQIVLPYSNPENFVSGAITTAMTGTTTTSLVAAPAAGLRNYLTSIIVSNSHATVGTDVVIQDGSGGATLMTIPAAAVYGGAVINLPVPLRQPTTATAIYCANVTTGASTKVSAVGYKGA